VPMVSVDADERAILLKWKKRDDSFILVRLKAEAVLYASMGVDAELIAVSVERTPRTVSGWLEAWEKSRLHSVVTGHAGNENAAKLTEDQKSEVAQVLASPPAKCGVRADFWDVPALRDVVKILFDVEYESRSSYQLLMKFLGMSFKLPDPFDKRRDEDAITTRMAEVKAQVAGLLEDGCEVYTVDEVRVEHEAETRRMWLPRGERTKLYVDRERAAKSFFGALSLTTKRMKIYPIDDMQNAEQMILMMSRLVRETSAEKIAVVLDNASFHHAKSFTKLFAPGEIFERVTLIYLPPYAPDHNPTEHVWNTAKGNIANLQRSAPEETFGAFKNFVSEHEFDYDFENLPIVKQAADFV